MIGGLLGGLVRRNEETGLNPLQNIAASMDALVMPKYRMGDQIRQSGLQRVAVDRRNATIAEMQKRADAGDTVAQRYLQGIQSGALDMKTGFAGYLNEVAANERLQREMNARAALARASAAKKATYKAVSGAELNKAMGTNLPADKLYNIGSDGKITQVGGSAPSISVGKTEGAYDKEMGEYYAKRNIAVAEDAQNAADGLRTIQIQRNLAADPSFRSGTGVELFNTFSSLLEQLGIGEADIASTEAFTAFASQSVLDALGGSLGTGVSNADVAFIKQTVANAGTTGAGIQKILDLREDAFNHRIKKAEVTRKWMIDNNTEYLDARYDAYIAEWERNNPPFANANSILNE